MYKSILRSVFYLCIFGTVVTALNCYECNSANNTKCGINLDAFTYTDIMTYNTTCEATAIGCRKMVLRDFSMGTLIVRSCYNDTSENTTDSRNDCFDYHLMTSCICSTDLCNMADTVYDGGFSFSKVFFIVTFFHYYL